MKKTFKDIAGNDFVVEFTQHDISKYDVIFHVTPKTNRKRIEMEGLLLNQPQHKSIIETGLL